MSAPWILAITLIVLGGIAAIVVIHLWGSDAQEQQTITAIVTFVGPTLAALLALYKTHENGAKVDRTLDEVKRTNDVQGQMWRERTP